MSADAAFWLNVDTPTKRCVLHRAGCPYAQAKAETPYKGIGHLKRDGGWIGHRSEADAHNYHQSNRRAQRCAFKRCEICW